MIESNLRFEYVTESKTNFFFFAISYSTQLSLLILFLFFFPLQLYFLLFSSLLISFECTKQLKSAVFFCLTRYHNQVKSSLFMSNSSWVCLCVCLCVWIRLCQSAAFSRWPIHNLDTIFQWPMAITIHQLISVWEK